MRAPLRIGESAVPRSVGDGRIARAAYSHAASLSIAGCCSLSDPSRSASVSCWRPIVLWFDVGDAPNHAIGIVADEHGTIMRDGDPHGPRPDRRVVDDKTG